MTWSYRVVACLVVIATICSSCFARDATFTIRLSAGKVDCFYDYIHEGAFLEIEYQVIEGGDLDINFIISDPDKTPIVMEPHSMDGLHAVDIKKTGEYEICLDNSFSRLTDKLLFLDIIIEDDQGEVPGEEIVPYQLSQEAVFMEMTVKDIREKLDRINKALSKVTSTQSYFKARESRHRHTVDSSYNRVQWWSLLELVVIVAVGVIQVFLVRSLFRTQRKDRIRT